MRSKLLICDLKLTVNKMVIWKSSTSLFPIRWKHVEFRRRKLDYLTSHSFECWRPTGTRGQWAFQKRLRARKPEGSTSYILVNYTSFNIWARYFVWNSTQNMLPIHWKFRFLCYVENLQVIGSMSSYVFWNVPRPPQCSLLWLGYYHYSDVMMGTMASLITSLTSSQPFIHAQIKENIKAPRHWPLCGEFTWDQWIPRTYGQ